MDRAQIPEWVDEQNKLVLGDEPCSHFLLVNLSNEDIIGTYPAPADAERILARIADLPDELPTGQQAIKLIAVGRTGALRAAVTMPLQGRSPGAKRAQDDMIQHARAMNATLGGMEQSMASMAARAQAADQSAAVSEARAREMQTQQFELVQFCQKMVLERQAETAKLEEAKARSETFKMLGQQAAPYIGPLIQVATEWWTTKRDKEKAELERIRSVGKNEEPEIHDHRCSPASAAASDGGSSDAATVTPPTPGDTASASAGADVDPPKRRRKAGAK